METTIIYFFVVLSFILLYLLSNEKQRRQALEKQLNYYDRQRFYRQERQKIIEHYCRQFRQGKVDLEITLHNLETDLSANSGGDNDWLQEYKSIKKILLAEQD